METWPAQKERPKYFYIGGSPTEHSSGPPNNEAQSQEVLLMHMEFQIIFKILFKLSRQVKGYQ